MKSNSTAMMTGCRFIHEAVEADQSGNFGEAHAQYTKALGLFASCDDDKLDTLGALMGGSREDAEGLLSRSEERALELQAIIAGEQPAETSSGNAHKIDEPAEVANFSSAVSPVVSPVFSPVAHSPDPGRTEEEAQQENDWDCATPRTPKNAAESDQQQQSPRFSHRQPDRCCAHLPDPAAPSPEPRECWESACLEQLPRAARRHDTHSIRAHEIISHGGTCQHKDHAAPAV